MKEAITVVVWIGNSMFSIVAIRYGLCMGSTE